MSHEIRTPGRTEQNLRGDYRCLFTRPERIDGIRRRFRRLKHGSKLTLFKIKSMSEAQPNQTRIVEMETFPDPSFIENGIVFVRALWSGYSKVSFANLVKTVQIGLDSTWRIIVVNTEHLQMPEFTKLYGGFPSSGGWGEAFWIKNGVLVHSDRGYYNAPLTKLLWRRILEFSTLENLNIPDFSKDDEFSRSVLRNCGNFPVEQLQINDLDCAEIEDLEVAVIVIYHVNRATAVVSLRALAKELSQVTDPRLKLIVLNEDAVSFADMNRVFGEGPCTGKIYWIATGKITSKDEWMSALNQGGR